MKLSAATSDSNTPGSVLPSGRARGSRRRPCACPSVLPQPTIATVLAKVGRLDIAAEIAAIDLGALALCRRLRVLRTSDAIASLILCARTKAVLYCVPRSRASASMLLPLTSFAKIATAIRYARSGILWNANSVPEVTLKSLRQALQRQRGAPFGRRQA